MVLLCLYVPVISPPTYLPPIITPHPQPPFSISINLHIITNHPHVNFPFHIPIKSSIHPNKCHGSSLLSRKEDHDK